MILDVGCCQNPQGTVNIDISRNALVSSKATNPVICDAHNLPFRNKSFASSMALCSLEHLEYPYVAIKEIMRVTRISVKIRYDCFWSIYNFMGVGHRNLMAKERFIKLPRILFIVTNKIINIKPVYFVLKKGLFFHPSTYDKLYLIKGVIGDD